MATLMGFSSGITVGLGSTGRSGPGTQIVPDPDPPGPPPGCICGITDALTRTVVGGWGISDAGYVWHDDMLAPGVASVDGSRGIISISGGNEGLLFLGRSDTTHWTDGPPSAYDVTVRVQATSGTGQLNIWLFSDGSTFAEADFYTDGTLNFYDSGPDSLSTVMGWGAGTDTMLRVVGVGRTADLYVWKASDPAPLAPTLSLNASGWKTNPWGPWSGIGLGATGIGLGTFVAAYNSLDIVDVNRCTAVQFDNFNRVFTGGGGVATNGVAWSSKSGGGTINVNGGQAVFDATTLSTNNSITWNVGGAAPAPWLPAPATPRSAQMRARWWFDFAVAGSGQGYVSFNFIPGSHGSPVPTIKISSVQGAYGYSIEKPKFDWVRNLPYIAEWVYDAVAGTVSFVIYPEGSTPSPGDWSTRSDTMDQATFDLFYFNGMVAASHPFYVDYIDFDYVGKPCYPGAP